MRNELVWRREMKWDRHDENWNGFGPHRRQTYRIALRRVEMGWEMEDDERRVSGF